MDITHNDPTARLERHQEIENYFDNGIEAGWVKHYLVPRIKSPADISMRSVGSQKM